MAQYLIFGNGWIGNKFTASLPDAALSRADITNKQAVHEAIEEHNPNIVINCAGKTGRPNVDWCEDHQRETYLANVVGPMTLRDACLEQKVHFVHVGSGCVYEGDNNGHGFAEDDLPNYFGSYYSKTKIWAEEALAQYPVLQLRLRMPVDKGPHDRNLITKLVKYQRVINVQNSLSIIDDFLYAGKCLMEKGCTGIYNITNPGAMGHARLLTIYQEIVDPTFTFTVMPLTELMTKVKTGRSNCVLSTKKLAHHVTLDPIETAMRKCLEHYKQVIDARK
ncbi:sugar nucleotide-binding protein [Candidatus Woesearchaeota archaeon]|nr:sugar nucleotide-binding protein [Candidatus Woesearchaeota archaeon]